MSVPQPFPPSPVLRHFAAHVEGLAWHRAPAGFSGAEVWRGDDAGGPRVALKGWPAGTAPGRVRQVHGWLARAAHLPFLPTIFRGDSGDTISVEAGRVWDCCRWQPGAPLLAPTATEVQASCEAVALLHAVWAPLAEVGPCPGVGNRLTILSGNEPLLRAGPGALPPVSAELDPLLREAIIAAGRAAPGVAAALRPWASRAVSLQPCARDLRAEHVLFESGRVTGLIDFGAAAVDSPAVDLARLLGDFAAADDSHLAAGLAAYRRARPAFDAPDELVWLLAHSGAVCSVLGWLVRLAVRREPASDPAAVRARLAGLIDRVRRIP